jgi:transcriptional regulator GlxA family with amidase domain
LEKATQLLRETDISITQVAFMSGFSELPPFTKFFRRNLDLSPSDYRSQHRR